MRPRSAAVSVALVRRAAGHAAAWTRSHPLAADALLAAALIGAAVLSSRSWISLYRLGDPSYDLPTRFEELAGLVATIGPLALRRRAPLFALVACTAGFLGARLLLDSLEQAISILAVAIAIYSAAAYGSPRRRNVVCAVCLVAMMPRLWYETGNQVAPDVPDRQLVLAIQMLTSLLIFGAMWALGAAIGSGRGRAAEVLDQTVGVAGGGEGEAGGAGFGGRGGDARGVGG